MCLVRERHAAHALVGSEIFPWVAVQATPLKTFAAMSMAVFVAWSAYLISIVARIIFEGMTSSPTLKYVPGANGRFRQLPSVAR